MDVIGKLTEIIGGVMVMMRRKDAPKTPAFGAAPTIPEARQQGIMTLKMPTARGWARREAQPPDGGARGRARA